jgi:hypothetical protein
MRHTEVIPVAKVIKRISAEKTLKRFAHSGCFWMTASLLERNDLDVRTELTKVKRKLVIFLVPEGGGGGMEMTIRRLGVSGRNECVGIKFLTSGNTGVT